MTIDIFSKYLKSLRKNETLEIDPITGNVYARTSSKRRLLGNYIKRSNPLHLKSKWYAISLHTGSVPFSTMNKKFRTRLSRSYTDKRSILDVVTQIEKELNKERIVRVLPRKRVKE